MASRFQPQRRVSVSELDRELELLREFSPLMKMQRNAHVPMCKLPAELLIYIFDLLRDVWDPDWERKVYSDEEEFPEFDTVSSSTGDISHSLGWMNATHVCSAWRKVALSTPSLWCNVNCSGLSSRMRKTVLKRSAKLPLRLTLDFEDRPSRRDPGAWAKDWLSQPTRKRVRSLELISIPDSPEKFKAILRRLRDLPQLVSLVVQREEMVASADAPLAIHSHLATPFPQLAKLSFLDCFPPLSSPIFSSNLTYLSLKTYYDEIHESVPTVGDTVVLLSA
ncbi:hypothetical protein PENSPDRAFT_190547 [Peniophora sp. CONT]|nr:hypothetical protein PENSPDRAFT_190547 [Peniophora sp. CONT]